MAVLREIPSDGYSGMEWMAMAAVLGALYCTVLGVFKRFRASMTFSMGGMEVAQVEQGPRAVYRPLGSEGVYTYSVLQETQNGTASTLKLEPARPRPKVILPPSSAPTPVVKPGPSTELPKTDQIKNSNKLDPSINSVKPKDSKEKKVTKTGEVATKESKEKKDREKSKKEKSKKGKGESKGKDEKSKKDKDKKSKKKGEKKVKTKDLSQLVASVTIDEGAVASNQSAINPLANQAAVRNPLAARGISKNPIANPVAAPPPYEEQVFSKIGNLKGSQINNPIAEQNEAVGFSSSWDQIAQHRQNIQRDVNTFDTPTKNLRAMGNQGKDGKEINSLYLTSNNSPRNNNVAGNSRRYSPPSDVSSGQESDTEA